jgi:hypothetical protein
MFVAMWIGGMKVDVAEPILGLFLAPSVVEDF